MPRSYEIDREKFGLPCGDDDPVYSAELWVLSKGTVHAREALKAFGPQVADLFTAAVGGAAAGDGDYLPRIAAGGYLSSLIAEASDFDLVDSFKRMAADAQLKRSGRDGTVLVYENAKKGEALSQTDTVNGLESYYAGKVDEVARLWWAMLCENTAPFGALHGLIARVLQRPKPAPSQQP